MGSVTIPPTRTGFRLVSGWFNTVGQQKQQEEEEKDEMMSVGQIDILAFSIFFQIFK